MTRVRRHLTYSNVVSSLCLFLLLGGGTAYALDGSDTVFSDDIVNGEVKEADVGQGAVASAEIKNDSILPGDVAPNSLTSPRIADASLTGIDIANNSLKGADVDESTLDIGDTARAYALVPPVSFCHDVTGDCDFYESKGISSVTATGNGRYCIIAPGIDGTVTPAAVSAEAEITVAPAGNASAMPTETGFFCGPDGEGFEVVTQRQPNITVDAGGSTNNATAVGPAAPANDVAFTIVIP
jgi:hypothetical protein